MIIKVHVVPNAKRMSIKKEDDYYIVHVDAPPLGGKANKKLIEILAGYFGVKKSDVTIIKGMRSREKLVEIINATDKRSL